MVLRLVPRVPVGIKPTPDSFGGPASVPGDWWEGLKAAIPLWEGAGASSFVAQELVANIGNKAWDSGPAWVQGDDGPALSTVDGGGPDFGSAAEYTVSLPWTWCVRFKHEGNRLFVVSNNENFDDTQHHGTWIEPYDDGTIAINYGDSTGGGSNDRRTLQTTSSPLVVGRWHTVVAYMNGAATGGIYVDGIKYAFTASGSGNSIVHDSGKGMAIGDRYAAGSGRDADISAAFLWDRQLNSAEIADLARDPYAPIRSYSYVGAPDVAATSILPFMMQYAH